MLIGCVRVFMSGGCDQFRGANHDATTDQSAANFVRSNNTLGTHLGLRRQALIISLATLLHVIYFTCFIHR